MGNVITYRMDAGHPGAVTRTAGSVMEPGIVGASDVPLGGPVKIFNGLFVPLEDGDSAADMYGVMVRSFPSQGGTGTLIPGVISAGAAADVLRSGYMAVKLEAGTSAKGDTVYVRTAPDTGKDVGDIEAGTATGNVAIPAQFMGEADANGVVEISYNI